MQDISQLAANWYSAEIERKMRQREARLAWLLAFKAGVELREEWIDIDDARCVAHAETDEQKAALHVANEARIRYRHSASRAGALRGALTRSLARLGLLVQPEPHAGIMHAYDAFCEAQGLTATEDE